MAHISRLHWLPIAGLLATLTIAGAGWDQAEARAARSASPRAIHGPSYRPPYAAIVIDDKSGQVLHEDHADEPRHPASLTKIMLHRVLLLALGARQASSLPLREFMEPRSLGKRRHVARAGVATSGRGRCSPFRVELGADRVAAQALEIQENRIRKRSRVAPC